MRPKHLDIFTYSNDDQRKVYGLYLALFTGGNLIWPDAPFQVLCRISIVFRSSHEWDIGVNMIFMLFLNDYSNLSLGCGGL